jgi:4-amino-4-deoxy-L-arabinose transferase-like glycosyltransferase
MKHSRKPGQKPLVEAQYIVPSVTPPGVRQPPAHPAPRYPQNGAIHPGHENGGAQGQQGITPTSMLQHEVEGDDMILYRSQRFFVRTANRPDQRHNPLRIRSGNVSLFSASFVSQIRWLSAEKQRITEAETRTLPGVEAINPVQAKAIPFPLILEAMVVIIGLAVAVAAHAFNMFNYPLYGQDEGTLMSNAWAILHGMLQPYPYIYEQPPLGWIQIAAWIKLSGGFFTFGNAINSGRILMLLFAVASSLLVYLIANRLSGSRSTGLLAMIIFSLSPLSIIYQRQVLLDNIGTFWLLLALYLLVVGDSRLRATVFAAISLGIAVLTKELFLIFLPAMLYAVWLHSTTFQRKFALVVFAYVTLSLASFFVLLALLKGELLPTGVLPWDNHAHPSLIGTLLAQITRPTKDSDLSTSWATWTSIDSPFIFASIGALVINLIMGWWNRLQWVPAFLALSFWLFMLRGGTVYPFSIVALLPLMAINIAVAINAPMKWATRHVGSDLARALLIFSLIGALIPYNVQSAAPVFSLQPTSAQSDALLWIRNNVPNNAVVIINSTLFTDLREPGGEGVADGSTYANAHIYWNVALDPEIHGGLLHENWQSIDYIVVDTNMLHDIKTLDGSMLLLNRALHHAILRTEFRANNGGQTEVIQIYQVIHNDKK